MTEPQLIQPTGFHLHLSSDWLVNAVSANVGDFLPVAADQSLGQPMTDVLCDDAIHEIRNRMALLRGDVAVEHLLHCSLVSDGRPFDLSICRDGDGFGIDAEPSDGRAFGDATGIVEGMLGRVGPVGDAASIAAEAARQLRALTGFDRILIHGGGQLLGQNERAGMSEVEPTAVATGTAELSIADSEAAPVAILTHGEREASRSTLRLPTSDERAMLAACDARAALIVPLTRGDRHWGHVGCYHGKPRQLGVERRSVARLFVRIIALQIELAELRRG